MQNIGKYFKFKFGEMKKARAYYLFLLPYALIFTTFIVIPVIVSIGLSFTSFNMIQSPRFIFIDNYYQLFMVDDLFLTAVKNTIVFSAITGPVGYLMCLGFAWLINEMPPKIRAVMTLLFYAPAISGNSYVIFTFLFSADEYGFLNSRLLDWGFINEAIPWLKNEATIPACVIVVILWMSLGTGFLSLIAGLQSVDRELYEAGAIDGIKNRWQELWFITLPSMKEHLMFAAVMSITGSFGMGAMITQLVGFPSPNYAAHTIVHHLEDYGNLRFEMGYASAIATLLFLLMVGANQLVQKFLRKVGT
ncbi:MAG: ABC transporter permease [Clostridiales bacterium]|nr:MAG: ABC transporter permease [Clostridiales bacterium]